MNDSKFNLYLSIFYIFLIILTLIIGIYKKDISCLLASLLIALIYIFIFYIRKEEKSNESI